MIGKKKIEGKTAEEWFELREVVKIFINYLEKNKDKHSKLWMDLWMDLDCLDVDIEPTKLLKRILSAYTYIKENPRNINVDDIDALTDRVLHNVRINYLISENGKDELRKDLNSAAKYLILLLQSERKDLKEVWDKIKTKFDVPLNPLFSPKYGDVDFYTAVQEYILK